MIDCIRETGLVAPLAGGALLVTVLVGVSACAGLPFNGDEETAARPAEVGGAPVTVAQHGPAPEERMPPPFEAAEPRPAPPLPRGKPALVLLVEPGDSVGSIAQRHGVAAVAIITFNELSHPYWLQTGQRLAIPRASHAVVRRNGAPAEASRYAHGTADMTVTGIEFQPEAPARAEPEESARTVIAAPVPRIDVVPVEPMPMAQVAPTEPAPVAQVEPDAPEAPRSPASRVARAEPEAAPSPSPRLVRAEPEATSPAPTLYALSRQPDGEHVPLPPRRDTFLWPIEGRVISAFGAKPGGRHNDGINIAAAVGSEVRAAQTGVVAYAGNELRGYGNLVLIRHDGGWMTAYAHNDALLVGKGDMVKRGQVISHSGRSGSVSSPQTHFEIRRDGEPQNPLRLLTRE